MLRSHPSVASKLGLLECMRDLFKMQKLVHSLYNLPMSQLPTSHSLDLSYCFQEKCYPSDSDDGELGRAPLPGCPHKSAVLPTAGLLKCSSAYKWLGSLVNTQNWFSTSGRVLDSAFLINSQMMLMVLVLGHIMGSRVLDLLEMPCTTETHPQRIRLQDQFSQTCSSSQLYDTEGLSFFNPGLLYIQQLEEAGSSPFLSGLRLLPKRSPFLNR